MSRLTGITMLTCALAAATASPVGARSAADFATASSAAVNSATAGPAGMTSAASDAKTTAACANTPTASAAMARLRVTMAQGRFIAYDPTSLQVVNGHSTQADPASIRADLSVLRPRFDALITYGSINGAEAIPAIAASLGFHAVIIGIWNPFDATELNAAITAAKANPKIVVGLSLGNEMVISHRRTFADLDKLIETVHAQAPQLPLTTTEPFHLFLEPAAAPILAHADFLLTIVHPIFQPWFRNAPDSNAAQFVVNVVSQLAERYCGPILVKETGEPTTPATSGFTEQRQAAFYAELQHQFPASNSRAFAYFAAFDAPWRLRDVSAVPGQPPRLEEAHWGLYDEERRPKPVVAHIPLLEH